MAFVSGENFFYTNTINRTEEIERFIRYMDGSAVVLKEAQGVLTLDMIFVEPKLVHDEMIEVKCVYAEDNWEEFYGSKHLVPFKNLISYSEALDSRDFVKPGDIVVGLPNSRNYEITSCDAFFIGKVLPIHHYDHNGDWSPVSGDSSEAYRRRWGDTEITVEVLYSTSGSIGEKHDVSAHYYIPTKNPIKNLDSYTKVFSHIAARNDESPLVGGVAYPIASASIAEGYKLEAHVSGFEDPIVCDFSKIRLFKKGEF